MTRNENRPGKLPQPESVADFKLRIKEIKRAQGELSAERPPIVAPRGAHWAQLDRMEREKAQRQQATA